MGRRRSTRAPHARPPGGSECGTSRHERAFPRASNGSAIGTFSDAARAGPQRTVSERGNGIRVAQHHGPGSPARARSATGCGATHPPARAPGPPPAAGTQQRQEAAARGKKAGARAGAATPRRAGPPPAGHLLPCWTRPSDSARRPWTARGSRVRFPLRSPPSACRGSPPVCVRGLIAVGAFAPAATMPLAEPATARGPGEWPHSGSGLPVSTPETGSGRR